MTTRTELISVAVAIICMIFAALATFFAYTTSPLYRGNRPRLVYKTASSANTEGQYSYSIHLQNRSSVPAKDVRVLINVRDLDKIVFRSDTVFSERDGLSEQKMLILDLIAANSEVIITADYKANSKEHEGMSVHMILNEFGEVSIPDN